MPFFRTTHNIFVDFNEHFDPNWMDSDKLILPPKRDWDYSREMQIEDVDIWEVIYEGGWGVYASWSPYAEFYLLTPPYGRPDCHLETFYGKNAVNILMKKMKELNIPFSSKLFWVEPEDMWLYTE